MSGVPKGWGERVNQTQKDAKKKAKAASKPKPKSDK